MNCTLGIGRLLLFGILLSCGKKETPTEEKKNERTVLHPKNSAKKDQAEENEEEEPPKNQRKKAEKVNFPKTLPPYDPEKINFPLPQETKKETQAPVTVKFAQIKSTLTTKCGSCHNVLEIKKKNPNTNYTTFATLRVYGSLLPTSEPFKKLTPGDQMIINSWINGGLTEQLYLASVKNVIDTNCISCHSATAPSNKKPPKSDFSLDQDIVKYASQMPTVDAFDQLLSPDEKTMFKQWITQGMPMQSALE